MCFVPRTSSRFARGIVEQFRPAEIAALGFSADSLVDQTGVLVPARDAERMADAVLALLRNNEVGERLGDNAFRDARARFDLNQQGEAYLNWYRTIVKGWKASPTES